METSHWSPWKIKYDTYSLDKVVNSVSESNKCRVDENKQKEEKNGKYGIDNSLLSSLPNSWSIPITRPVFVFTFSVLSSFTIFIYFHETAE